uniref:Uncharacterized protein n=1 Tax=Molossus molossus TaxID=27622 RepID=A0A7J8DPZ0_MOLMO|nr:hypothetical protein HJG59_009228 [Molossus molossus]
MGSHSQRAVSPGHRGFLKTSHGTVSRKSLFRGYGKAPGGPAPASASANGSEVLRRNSQWERLPAHQPCGATHPSALTRRHSDTAWRDEESSLREGGQMGKRTEDRSPKEVGVVACEVPPGKPAGLEVPSGEDAGGVVGCQRREMHAGRGRWQPLGCRFRSGPEQPAVVVQTCFQRV